MTQTRPRRKTTRRLTAQTASNAVAACTTDELAILAAVSARPRGVIGPVTAAEIAAVQAAR